MELNSKYNILKRDNNDCDSDYDNDDERKREYAINDKSTEEAKHATIDQHKEENNTKFSIDCDLKVAKLKQLTEDILREKKVIDEFMEVEVSEEQCALLQKHLGWCPVSLTKKINMQRDVPKLCQSFVTILDNSLLKASLSIANFIKCRNSINSAFELIGDDSKTKQYLKALQVAIDKGLDNYTTNIQDASCGFLILANAFGKVYEIIDNGGDSNHLVTKFDEIEIDFKDRNDKLDKQLNELVSKFAECREFILDVQNAHVQTNLKGLQQHKQEFEQKFEQEERKYEDYLDTYQSKEIKLEEDIIRNNNQLKNYRSMLEQINDDMKYYSKMNKSYEQLIQQYNDELKTIEKEKRQEFKQGSHDIKSLILQIKKEQNDCLKSYTHQIEDIKKRIEAIKSKLVELQQKEQEQVQKLQVGDGWFASENYNFVARYNRQQKKKEYGALRAVKEQELKHYDDLLPKLIRHKKEASLQWRDQLKTLENDLIKNHNNNDTQFPSIIQQNQQLKINKIKHDKDKNLLDCENLRQQKEKIESEVTNIQVNLNTLKTNKERLQNDDLTKLQEYKKAYEKAKSQRKEAQNEYENEMKIIQKKYGLYDITKVVALNQLLITLSQQCQNIGIQFREISVGIKYARTSFSSSDFADLLCLKSEEKRTKLLLQISKCYHQLGLIAFNLFQQPLQAISTNDLKTFQIPPNNTNANQNAIAGDKSRPIVEEVE